MRALSPFARPVAPDAACPVAHSPFPPLVTPSPHTPQLTHTAAALLSVALCGAAVHSPSHFQTALPERPFTQPPPSPASNPTPQTAVPEPPLTPQAMASHPVLAPSGSSAVLIAPRAVCPPMGTRQARGPDGWPSRSPIATVAPSTSLPFRCPPQQPLRSGNS